MLCLISGVCCLTLLSLTEYKTYVLFSGYTIPKGWKVQVWFRHVHMDPEVYPDPKEFNPDRWDVSMITVLHHAHIHVHMSRKFLFCICLNSSRYIHPKLELSFPLEQEAGYVLEMILQRWKSPFSFTIFSLVTSE